MAKTAEQIKQEKDEARGRQVWGMVSGKDKRTAVKYFDTALEDFDAVDMTVLMAYVADGRKHSLEHYDELPQSEIEKLVAGE